MWKDLQIHTIEELEKHLYVNKYPESSQDSEHDESDDVLSSEAWTGFLATSGSGFLAT